MRWRSRAATPTRRAGTSPPHSPRSGQARGPRRVRLKPDATRAISSRILKGCAAFCLALTLAACATNPVTGKRELSLLSEAQEIQIGQAQDAQIRIEMGVYGDRELQQYVGDIGFRLAHISERPNLPWHFTVVDVPAINAFALPGGYIYITRGILPFLDNEAAGWDPAGMMNGDAVSERPRPGERLKFVVAE